MERHVRQFQILEDASLFEAYRDMHQKFQLEIFTLGLFIRDYPQEQQVKLLADREQMLFDALRDNVNNPPQFKELTKEFGELTSFARVVLSANDTIPDEEAAATEAMAAKTQRWLLWQAVAVIPGAVLFSAIFIALISRPIRQIDRAIHDLGAGDFAQAIHITGPRDLQYLGERLNWLRRRLDALEEEKRQFLRHVSHELKTPLTAMREGAALLAEGVVGTLSAAQSEVVGILQENCGHLQVLIENLLHFQQAQARSAAFVHTPVRLDQVLAAVTATHKLAVQAKEIMFELDTVPVSLLGDADKLRIALDNLVSNAVKFSPRQSTIHLQLRRDADTATVDIQDHGPGIIPEERSKVFEAFYQGTAPALGPIKGSGLGLAIAKEYVTAHAGTLEVVDAAGPGAHVRMILPLHHDKETL
jgi:two-component system sensor histidine kinase GlrK